MLNRIEFGQIIEPLLEVFVPPTKKQLDIYFERLKYTEDYLFKKAIEILIDHHPVKRFPLPNEIKNAIQDAQMQSSEATPGELDQDEYCEACHGTGIQLHPVLHLGYERETAFPCDKCRKGLIFKRAWEHNRKKKGRFILTKKEEVSHE